jgi:hypothetical protein
VFGGRQLAFSLRSTARYCLDAHYVKGHSWAGFQRSEDPIGSFVKLFSLAMRRLAPAFRLSVYERGNPAFAQFLNSGQSGSTEDFVPREVKES